MKKKIIGLVLLILVMAAVAIIYFLQGSRPRISTEDGYTGAETIVFLED